MEIARRSLEPGETDHELVWLCVSLGGLALATAWFALHLPWPKCAFHDLTGLPCLTCGMTRSGIQFFHGNFLAAIRWNPLVFAALCAITIFNIYAFFVLITRARRVRFVVQSQVEKRYLRVIAVAVLLLNWTYLLSQWRIY